MLERGYHLMQKIRLLKSCQALFIPVSISSPPLQAWKVGWKKEALVSRGGLFFCHWAHVEETACLTANRGSAAMLKALAFVSRAARPKEQSILGNSEVIKELIFEHTESSSSDIRNGGKGARTGHYFSGKSPVLLTAALSKKK